MFRFSCFLAKSPSTSVVLENSVTQKLWISRKVLCTTTLHLTFYQHGNIRWWLKTEMPPSVVHCNLCHLNFLPLRKSVLALRTTFMPCSGFNNFQNGMKMDSVNIMHAMPHPCTSNNSCVNYSFVTEWWWFQVSELSIYYSPRRRPLIVNKNRFLSLEEQHNHIVRGRNGIIIRLKRDILLPSHTMRNCSQWYF